MPEKTVAEKMHMKPGRKVAVLNAPGDDGGLVEQAGAAPKPRVGGAPKPVEVPSELAAALRESAPAKRCFEALPPSHQREYADWVGEAKRPETRARRVDRAIEMLTAGQRRR